MEETFIVVMLKEKNSGFLVKEIGTYAVTEYSNYLVNINAEETTDEKVIVNMKVMYDSEIEDWQYNAICDYYDTSELMFDDRIINCVEIEECYEPTWEVTFNFTNDDEVEELIHNILEKHHFEILAVLDTIKDKKEEYNI